MGKLVAGGYLVRVRLYGSVDLGGTTIGCAAANEEGKILSRNTASTRGHEGPDRVLERIAGQLQRVSATGGGILAAVGFGIPGLVDIDRGVTRFLPNLATQWRDVPAADILAERIGCPVYLMNDARMATLGEMRFGRAQGVQTFAMLTIGTGIGGGIVVDGRLRLGPLGAAGEIGHQTLVADGPLCGCGSRGCLESLASGSALTGEGVRMMRAGLAPKLHAMVAGEAGVVDPAKMAAAAEQGDVAVRDAILRAARWIGIGVANIVTSLHPELVVIGGGVAAIGPMLIDAVREEVTKRVRMFPVEGVRVEASALGDTAGLYGGIALAMQGGVARPKNAKRPQERAHGLSV
jgi:glucokinase